MSVFKFFKFLKFSQRSFSQQGEDIIVRNIFNLRGIKNPSYIDIGAHHPFHLSNTAKFYNHGSRGVNIEANPFVIHRFKRWRKGDMNLNIGVAPVEGKFAFFINYENPELFCSFVKQSYSQGAVAVDCITLNQVMAKYFVPDLLTIDAEGWDYDILADMKLFPKVICVETAEYHAKGCGGKNFDIVNRLDVYGYSEYAYTGLNSIFVRKDFWFV